MDREKRTRLGAAGFQVGTVRQFLRLSEAEARLVEIQVALATELRERREKAGLTQVELAKRLRSSQSRVAKMEAGDPSVSIDLLLRALFVVGATPRHVGAAITSRVA